VATDVSVRRILHCDMDCFYAAVHMRDDPSLRGLPVVIGGSPEGRGVVAAASYEARAFGIRSATPAARAVRLCPQAVFIKPDFARYREESQRVFAIFRDFTEIVQPVSIDEAYLDVSDCLEAWGSATAVAQAIRRRVREERGLTVSVGVAPNRLLAKIASDRDKPDGLTVVRPSQVQAFLDPLPVRNLPGVGPATERRLRQLGVETIAELRALPLDLLERRMGRHGAGLYRYARGHDERPVRIHRERKSLSAERTYATDLTSLEQMDEQLGRLAERVAGGLAKRELSARTVTLKVRYDDFTTLTRSHTLVAPTADAAELAEQARRLLRKSEAGRRAVRLLGVGGSNLVRGRIAQLALFPPAQATS
jgi:DNA polymerase-4